MKGDFSKVHFSPHDNFNGILPQQGKVLLDSEGIAQTLIENDWHETAARDWVGPIAGVPSGAPNSFEVGAASLSGGTVSLTVGTGHIWADGLLVRLGDEAGSTITRTATWLEPPIVLATGSAADVAAGTTDAVILEVWQHAVNGYQMPDKLIEPALGGPDTAERLKTSYAFRLARLAARETCADVTFDESGRGALTVSLVPPVVIGGDCPVEGSGGYSGFEHQFYRIEIANTNVGASQFKWSRVNGGLVGRGSFDPSTQKIAIAANLAAIASYNQTSFYLEIETYDASLGYAQVVTGTTATLSGNTLQCDATPTFGTYPATTGNIFFRLWDGLSLISSYPLSATPGQLENGILLQFDADGTGKYLPGDYWTFPVRAQGIANPQTLIDAKQPQGIVYHRVALAEITWASSGGGAFTQDTIEDCRTIVPPLSRTKGCCTCRVGDGVESFGDFPTIQAAVDALPPQGGEVCILPGRYYENIRIINRRDIVIHGCGWDTRVASKSLDSIDGTPIAGGTPNPLHAVFTIAGCEHIELRSFAVEAADNEVGILIDGEGASVSNIQPASYARAAISVPKLAIDVTVKDMVLTAAALPAILAARIQLLTIERNRIAMKNVRSTWPAVFASGREIHIQKNWVGVQSAATLREWLPLSVVNDLEPKTSSASLSSSAQSTSSADEIYTSFNLNVTETKVPIHPGGIQIGGPSANVYILENEIESGNHNGITLGSLIVVDDNGDETGTWTGISVIDGDDCCTGTLQPPTYIPGTPGTTRVVAGGILTNLHIHRNRIRNTGLCGIGPVAMFDLAQVLEIISIFGLNISQNEITRTVLRDLAVVSKEASTSIGYGAICVPDVINLIIRDNTITDFGAQPGARACGILVIHGEQIEISRNRVLETRDWKQATIAAIGSGACGGIIILQATPPILTQTSSAHVSASVAQTPTYEPGVPAARIEHNLVRVPLAYALGITGLGPMTIVNNHLSCSGFVRTSSKPIAQTVLILNLGTAIDSAAAAISPSDVFHGVASASVSVPPTSNGTVLFSNNICQLEARASRQTEISSITISTADHLIFTNNECWLDALRSTATWNALLVGTTLNVVANRFQETLFSVNYSALTAGKVNVTGQNISTYCLLAFGNKLANNNNLVLVPNNCDDLQKRLDAELGLSQ